PARVGCESRFSLYFGPASGSLKPIVSEISVAQNNPARFDELRDASGAIRAHWRPFARTLAGLTPEEFARRRASAGAMVRDNGVTYNVYDETAGQTRPWQLDIVPFIVSAADWAAIEAAVVQRAQLAELILSDIYGEQKLIAGG